MVKGKRCTLFHRLEAGSSMFSVTNCERSTFFSSTHTSYFLGSYICIHSAFLFLRTCGFRSCPRWRLDSCFCLISDTFRPNNWSTSSEYTGCTDIHLFSAPLFYVVEFSLESAGLLRFVPTFTLTSSLPCYPGLNTAGGFLFGSFCWVFLFVHTGSNHS